MTQDEADNVIGKKSIYCPQCKRRVRLATWPGETVKTGSFASVSFEGPDQEMVHGNSNFVSSVFKCWNGHEVRVPLGMVWHFDDCLETKFSQPKSCPNCKAGNSSICERDILRYEREGEKLFKIVILYCLECFNKWETKVEKV